MPLIKAFTATKTQWNVSRYVVRKLKCCILLTSYLRFQILTRDLEAVMLQYPNQSLANLPPNHDIRHLVRQIMLLAEDSANRERTPLMMSQKIVQLLYKTSSPLGREVYVALLDQLCRMFEDVAKQAITWLLYVEDEVSTLHTKKEISANICIAKIQCSCHSDFVKKWTYQYDSARPTVGEVAV